MANEYFKKTLIFMAHRKGLRRYPFSMCQFVDGTPGVAETILFSGICPDDSAVVYDGNVSFIDDFDTPEIQPNFMISPPFIYNDTLASGLRDR